jgi:light-regulated signal transduction histidine kinase (bacteriophytochrome)
MGLHSLKPEMKNREVQWRVGELPFVECDPMLVRQVITNLLTNALKFTRPRQPAIIEIGHRLCDGEPVVFVRDNGVGFSMKYADKLFGLSQRLHRQQDFEGMGVGLAIVQLTVDRHGGRFWTEGNQDKGATFYFTLQSSDAERETHPMVSQVA